MSAPARIEQFAKDVMLAIRGGEALPRGRWGGKRHEDQENTNECRRIAAILYGMGYRRIMTTDTGERTR